MNCYKCPLNDGTDDFGNKICLSSTGKCIYDKSELEEELKIEFDSTPIIKFAVDCVTEEMLGNVRNVAKKLLEMIITPEFKAMILDETKNILSEYIKKEIDTFMGKKINIGSPWGGDQQEVTRSEYLASEIEKQLSIYFDKDGIRRIAENTARDKVDKFTTSVKNDINKAVSTMFTDAVKKNLSESIVQLLLNNETYEKLQTQMSHICGELPRPTMP